MRDDIMGIKSWKFVCFIFLLTYLKTIVAAEDMLVERYENWNHPVLAVFKKYGISPYKVSYSKDGTCPTFYATFKYSPDVRDPGAKEFEKVYFEALKANSDYPYALVDKEDDMRINVGWTDRAKTRFSVDIDKASSVSTCKAGSVVDSKFILTTEMKKNIMSSPFSASLHTKDGKKIVAYLYAENERKKSLKNYPCFDGEKITTGHYYIYLYDVSTDSFLPDREAVFDGDTDIRMNSKKENFFTWPNANKNQANVLFVGRVATCEYAQYEAYGFSENQSHLKKYIFVDQQKYGGFYGEFEQNKNQDKLIANAVYGSPKMKKIYLYLSKVSGEIQMQRAS